MLHPRAPIPLVPLLLGAACSKPVSPPVECGDMTCPSGQICVYQNDACQLVDRPCEAPTTGDSTSEPESDRCWDFESTYRCEPIPEQCLDQSKDVEDCIEHYADQFCFVPDAFEDWALQCRDYDCRFIDYYEPYYCDNICP